jgi:branched-subunit amino acid aminotransferase/4-amino-4-deoxychorismate lyase
VLTLDMLDHADEIWLINSVRGWLRARLADDPRGPRSARITRSGSSDSADLVPHDPR